MHNDSWHWIDGEKDPMALGPRVTQNNWGIGEPGISKIMLITNRIITHNLLAGGDCVVMDSGMGWAWNAVRCVISGEWTE